MNIVRWSWLLVMSACASSIEPNAGGSESHFLDACEESSECGELECLSNVCTRACESSSQCEDLGDSVICAPAGETRICSVVPNASVTDGSTQETDAELLGTSDVLGEPAQLAFIAGTGAEEQLWLWGKNGALQQVSVWPAHSGWEQDWCAERGTSGYASGDGRFVNLTFDATGQYLVFVEKESCHVTEDEPASGARLVVYELATGSSWWLETFPRVPEISAGPRSTVASYHGEDGNVLFELDLSALMATLVEAPAGKLINANSQHIVALGEDDEVLITVGKPALRIGEDGFHLFEPLDQLDAEWAIGKLSASPSGEHLCTGAYNTRLGPGAEEHLALLMTSESLTIHSTPPRGDDCLFSADGRYAMASGVPFEIVGDDLVPLPPPSEQLQIAGSFGSSFFGTIGSGEVYRFDPATGTTEIVIDNGVLQGICEIEPRDMPYTRLHLAQDGRGVGIAQHYCGDADLDQSGSVAIDLETGVWRMIETGISPSHTVYDVAWPSEDVAWLFSSRTGEQTGSFYEISIGAEVTTRRIDQLGDAILHSPALPQ